MLRERKGNTPGKGRKENGVGINHFSVATFEITGVDFFPHESKETRQVRIFSSNLERLFLRQTEIDRQRHKDRDRQEKTTR